MNNNTFNKGLATVAAAILFGYMLFITKGEHGAGWFFLCVCVIWAK